MTPRIKALGWSHIFLVRQPRRPLSEVSREAREETTGDYVHVRKADCSGILANDVFFSPRLDMIYLPTETLYHHNRLVMLMQFQRQNKKIIRKLAFDITSRTAIEVLWHNQVISWIFQPRMELQFLRQLRGDVLVREENWRDKIRTRF
jgi:hypothetical protein